MENLEKYCRGSTGTGKALLSQWKKDNCCPICLPVKYKPFHAAKKLVLIATNSGLFTDIKKDLKNKEYKPKKWFFY